MNRVSLSGRDLDGFDIVQPAASVRLLLPSPGADELVVPTWRDNEFLLPDGSRPTIRTFTPRRFHPGTLELDVEIVIHGDGAASSWAEAVEPGAPAAISGPGRGYPIDPGTTGFFLAGDETALPAIGQLLETLPAKTPVQVRIELAQADARLEMPQHPTAIVEWLHLAAGAPPGDTLVRAVKDAEIDPDGRVWAAGEAAAMQRIRRHLFEERGLTRRQATVRGYWKHGRGGGSEEAELGG